MKKKDNLSALEHIIKELQQVSEQLMKILDKQTDAVVAVNEEQIERNAEKYTDLKKFYQKQEQKFIDELSVLLSADNITREDLRLNKLKKVFPQSSAVIDQWQDMLEKQTRKLKEKHQKLNTLLEFALERNTELIRSIYRMHNREYTQYRPSGDKDNISSGIAINKEV